jgi:hypothetical protein
MLKVMGLKILEMRGSFTFGMQRWVGEGNICMDMHLGPDHHRRKFKMGSNVLFDLLFEFFD